MAKLSPYETGELTDSIFFTLLVLTKPIHGYMIMQKVAEITNNSVIIGPATMYTTLGKMVGAGWIEEKEVDNSKKEYPILCDKIECYKKERGCNPMKKDRLIVLTDAVLAIIMTILILELEKPTTPSLEAFWDLRQNFFACFLSFFWLGSLWMALNTLWEKVEKISSEIIWWNLFLLLERQEFSLENFMPSKIPV